MPEPIILPVAEYMPDLPDFPASGSSNILNVYPRTPKSYGPVPTPMAQYNALNARCLGGAAFRDNSDNVYIFAGDTGDLYYLTAGTNTWTNASKALHGYAPDTLAQWQFAYFNGDVVATDYNDAPQVFTLGTSATFSDLAGSPPKGRYIATVKNSFLTFGDTVDPASGVARQRIWWSAAGDHKSWPTPGGQLAAQLQSGYVDLLGPGGFVQGIAPDLINADAAIFQEYAVRQMVYVGPPAIFDFLPCEAARGTPAPYSIVVVGGIAYYLGQDGFYAFDGGTSNPIGINKVDKFVLGDGGKPGDLDQNHINRVVGAADPVNRLVWWPYPGVGNTNGNPNRLLCYNYGLGRWALCNITCETIVKMLSIGYTLDQLYTVLGYTIDDLPAPLDSSVWIGGRLQLGLFDANHTLNFPTGTPLAATVETSEMQPIPGRRSFITNSRPLVDGVGTVPSIAIGHRERQQDAVVYGSSINMNSLGTCPQRVSGRYTRATIGVPAGSTAWNNISGVEIEMVQQGKR